MKKPGLEQLAMYRAGLLSAKAAKEVEQYLRAGSRRSRDTMKWLEQVERSASLEVRHSVPDHLVGMARQIYRQFTTNRQKAKRGLSLAVCVFDSIWRPLPAGVRPAVSDARRLLYVTDDFEVDLEINLARQGRYTLLGQVTGAGQPLESAIVVMSRGRSSKQVTTDALGVFSLAELLPGEIDLLIEAESAKVEVAQVPVGLV